MTTACRALVPVVRQVDALIQELRWSVDQAAHAAFPLVHGKRRIKHASDLLGRESLDAGRIAPHRPVHGRGGRYPEAKFDQLTNGVGSHRLMSFRPYIDVRCEPL